MEIVESTINLIFVAKRLKKYIAKKVKKGDTLKKKKRKENPQ